MRAEREEARLLDVARVRALVFDIDGTLSDTDDRWVKRLTRLAHPLRFLFPQRNPQPAVRSLVMAMDAPGNAVFALLDRLHLDGPLARTSAFLQRKPAATPRQGHAIIPGTLEMLQALSAHYPMAVFTARDSASTRAFLEQFQLQPYFQAVASALTCVHTKPYPDPLIWIAQQMGIDPSQCLMIGDTVVDICAGKAAGAQTVGVLCGFGSRDELARAGADLILPSPAHLLPLLLKDSPSEGS